MKINRLKTASLALAAAAMLTGGAQAVVVAGAGSVILGFEQEGAANNLEVNIGSYTNFLSNGQFGYTGASGAYSTAGVTFTITGLSVSDLSANFTDWNNNSQTNLLQWGAIGYNNSGVGVTLGVANRTIFYTVGREVPSVQSTAPNRQTSSAQGTYITGGFNLVRSALNGSNETANSSVSALIAAGNSGSFSTGNDNNWGGLGSVEQSLFGSNRGPTNSVLDFYASLPSATGGLAPTLLGTFALSDAGVLTYTAAAVPEPSTYVLLGLGLGSLVFLRRRFNRQKIAS